MKVRYLVDEHISARLTPALLRQNRSLELMRIGDHPERSVGLSNQQILQLCQREQAIFVTQDPTIFTAAAAHIAQGHQHCGVLVVRPLTAIGIIATALYEIWYCTNLADWLNTCEWIPL